MTMSDESDQQVLGGLWDDKMSGQTSSLGDLTLLVDTLWHQRNINGQPPNSSGCTED